MSSRKSPDGALGRRTYTVAVAGAGNAAANAVTALALPVPDNAMAAVGNSAMVTPPAAFPATITFAGCRINAAGTVIADVLNPTGGAVAIPDGNYRVTVFNDSEDP